ncbi:MAG: PEGA domain-containing protein [Alphaproteobacteria bacterium]|nr:PEGA domain-containing protein [Alphaproteobacteria bacterium]
MKKLVLVLTLILSVSACGTVFNGGSQDIQIDSNVSGVDIYINGMKACKTPCTFPIERSSSSIVINAKKMGYNEQQMMLKSEFSGIAILNLTFWPSWLTDAATGGMWKYNRDGVYIEMERAGGGYYNQGGYGNGYNRGYQQQYNQQQYNRQPQQRYNDRYSKNDETGAKTRRFSLYNYSTLKQEASSNKSGEYIKALAELTDKNELELIKIINNSTSEVNLAHTLTGISH